MVPHCHLNMYLRAFEKGARPGLEPEVVLGGLLI